MALEGTDLAILSARLGVARLGASRLGFYPCDVESTGATEPGEYVWKEVELPQTQWELQDDCEGPVCGVRPEADFSYAVESGPVADFTYEVASSDPLCWTWQSNPGEVTPTVEIAAVLVEDSPGQWDGGGTFTVTWWDDTTTVTNVTTADLGTVILGSKTRDYTAPTNPPPEETVTVSLTGGSPAVNRSEAATVQFQQDAGGAILTGNSAGCCQYEPFSLIYEECDGDCIATGGGGCP